MPLYSSQKTTDLNTYGCQQLTFPNHKKKKINECEKLNNMKREWGYWYTKSVAEIKLGKMENTEKSQF